MGLGDRGRAEVRVGVGARVAPSLGGRRAPRWELPRWNLVLEIAQLHHARFVEIHAPSGYAPAGFSRISELHLR